ncbi:hypothetical protein PT974_11404 [Cladobotryum mycophilum]|uniref:Cytochrome b561 domain-containing protein n=1 Tax=Cladobotryum mycophilum TaxID=491253 RepID=A0ABR0S550_9HYPO
MLLRNLGRAVLAAAALAPFSVFADDSDNPPGQSTFISPDKSLAFALTVPDNNNLDVYISLRVSKKRSWGAVGLGSDDMTGALFLILYANDKGDNVTFSPRLAYGNYEPKYYPELEYEVFDGTGIYGGYMTFHARCVRHCRSWPSSKTSKGYIDVSSPNQKAIYALGPKERFQDDDNDAPLKMHEEYGSFTIDMKRTMGHPDLPVLTDDSENEGTTLDNRTKGKSDWKAAVHATFMVLAFMGIIPAGAILIRMEKLAKFHKINQSVALLFVLGGFGIAIPLSFNYQRSRGFTSLHQILGFIVIFFVLAQMVLGLLHHIQWKKTQQPTIYSRIHVWVGRFIMVFGAINGYMGFSFAGDRRWALLVAGIVFFAFFGFLIYSVMVAKGQPRRQQGPGGFENYSHGYQPQPQPWRANDPNAGPAPAYPNDPPPGYEAPSGQIGLQTVSPWRSSSPTRRAYEDEPGNVGSAQKPREFA